MWETGEAQGFRGLGSLSSALQGRQEGMCATWSWGKGAQWAGWQRREYLWAYSGARP